MKKKLFTLALILSAFATAWAQKEFPVIFKSQFPVKTDWRFVNDERSLALGGNKEAIAMMDGLTGKILWTFTMKQKFGVKKCDDWDWDHTTNAVWILLEPAKKGEDGRKIFLDEQTGAEIGNIASRKQAPVKVQKKSREYVKDALLLDDNSIVNLSYERPQIASSIGKGTKMPITVQCSGATSWKLTFEGRVMRSLCTNAFGESRFGGDFLSMSLIGSKLFVIYEGITVIDVATGKMLWQTTFDNTEFDFGVFKSVQTVGRAAMPVADPSAAFIVDLSNKENNIKKLDLATGATIWQTETFKNGAIVPDLQLAGNVLLAQFGGEVIAQTYIPGTSGRPDVCKSEPKVMGDFGVKAYDVSTGKLLWQTAGMKELNDKFSGTITNIETAGNIAFFASDKNLFAVEALSGKVVFQVQLSKMKVGKPKAIELLDGNILVWGDFGVASVSSNTGAVNYATNTKKNLDHFWVDEACFIWVGKDIYNLNNFIRFDVKTGAILGGITETGHPKFTPDGSAFIKFDGAKVSRYSTK